MDVFWNGINKYVPELYETTPNKCVKYIWAGRLREIRFIGSYENSKYIHKKNC